MSYFGIMLINELSSSNHTFPIAERANSMAELDNISQLNSRVRFREDKNTHVEILVSSFITYSVPGGVFEKGGIYRFDMK